jgi:hypothetical protein
MIGEVIGYLKSGDSRERHLQCPGPEDRPSSTSTCAATKRFGGSTAPDEGRPHCFRTLSEQALEIDSDDADAFGDDASTSFNKYAFGWTVWLFTFAWRSRTRSRRHRKAKAALAEWCRLNPKLSAMLMGASFPDLLAAAVRRVAKRGCRRSECAAACGQGDDDPRRVDEGRTNVCNPPLRDIRADPRVRPSVGGAADA